MAYYGPTPAEALTPPTVRRVHGGQTVDYTPGTAKSAGDVVVQGSLVGIVKHDIEANKPGALEVEGCFEFPKASGDGGMAVGTLAYWDATNSVATGTSSGNQYVGKVETTAATGATSVRVQMESVANGTGSGFGNMPVAAVTATGSTISDGAALSAGFNLVTGLDNTTCVQLPVAAAGRVVVVKAGTSGKTLPVFPQVNSSINAIAANGAITIAANSAAFFVAYNSTAWFTVPLLPS